MMHTARIFRAAAVVGTLWMASCGGLTDRPKLDPEGQVVLAVATDAWLPRSADAPHEAVETTPLFERLRIEFFLPGDSNPCPGCTRDFGVDHRTVDEGRASVGFIPRPGASGYRARVRLYHSGASEAYSEPRPASTIEATVALPVVGADGVVRVHVVLRTDDLAKPRGALDAPIQPERGDPPKGLAGTWHAEVRRACAEAARPGEACVPGGAYWNGDPSFNTPFERLVAVSPFFIDLREVTCGEVRASGLAFLDVAALKADPYLYSSDPAKTIHYCTYTQNAADKEGLPVNCVTRELAQKFCEARGATLPTEAQFEFVQGARRDASFPWGEGDPTCDDAVFSRSFEASKPPEWRMCVDHGVGVAPPGSGKLDRVRMPDGGEIVDLSGNLSEWIADSYQTTDEACFKQNPVVDPICREASTVNPDGVVVRGDPWTDPGGSLLRAAIRQTGSAKAPQNPRVGFRCARPGG